MKSYFYKVRGDAGGPHWLFGAFESKKALIEENRGNAPFHIIAAKQLVDMREPEEIRDIAKNVLLHQPHVLGEFPQDIRAML